MATTDISKPVKVASIIHAIKQPIAAMTMLAELTILDIDKLDNKKLDKKNYV